MWEQESEVTEELKNCPFCGGKDLSQKRMTYRHETTWHIIKCKNCAASIHGIDWTTAYARWNKRV